MTSALKDTGCQAQSHGEAAPGGGPCPRCGRPRCSAAAKSRVGERCRKNPHPGATICTNHGLTQAGRAKAEEALAEVQASDAVRRLWPGLANAAPVKDPVDLLERLAGSLQQMVDVLGERIADLAHLEAGADLTRVRGQVLLFEKLLGHLRGTAIEMARLGIAEKEIAVQQVQADRIVAALSVMFEALVLSGEQRELGIPVFMDALRQRKPAEQLLLEGGDVA